LPEYMDGKLTLPQATADLVRALPAVNP
jgi:hypothetical protein